MKVYITENYVVLIRQSHKQLHAKK